MVEPFFNNEGLIHIGLEILEYLDPKSLGNCRRVNRTWCGLITNQRFWAVAWLDLLKLKAELEGLEEIRRKWEFWSKLVEKVKKEQSKEVLRKTAFFLNYQFQLSVDAKINEDKFNWDKKWPRNDGKKIDTIDSDPLFGIEQLLINGDTEFATILLKWLKDETPWKFKKKIEHGLFLSIIMGRAESVKLFLSDPFNDNINANKEMMHMPTILLACRYDIKVSAKVKIVEALLQRPELNVNAIDHSNFRLSHGMVQSSGSALHYSAAVGNIEIVAHLLKRNDINVNIADQHGKTPLHYAITCEKTKVVSMLLSHSNIDVNAQDDKLATPLHYACKGNITVMEELLKSDKIDVNARDEDGVTPLLTVMSDQCSLSLERAKTLLQHKRIDVNASAIISGISGTTPLHLVCRMKEIGASDLLFYCLLQVKGIDVNAIDGQGMTPFNYLRSQKRLASQKASASIAKRRRF